MADQRDNAPAVYGTALAILGLGLAVHYGYKLAPPEHRADIWSACGALARAGLLTALVWHTRAWVVIGAWAWFVAEELMVAGCSIAYTRWPWQVPAGEDQCSALAGFDLGRIGLCIACVILLSTVRPYRCEK